jgi:hypothetical protein
MVSMDRRSISFGRGDCAVSGALREGEEAGFVIAGRSSAGEQKTSQREKTSQIGQSSIEIAGTNAQSVDLN